jgi:hypothetical protein
MELSADLSRSAGLTIVRSWDQDLPHQTEVMMARFDSGATVKTVGMMVDQILFRWIEMSSRKRRPNNATLRVTTVSQRADARLDLGRTHCGSRKFVILAITRIHR